MVTQMSWARAVGAADGAGPCGGGGEGVPAACGTMARWEGWQGLVVVVGVFLVHVMVWCGPVRRVGCVACGVWLCWGVVVMELVGAAVVMGHPGVGVGGGGGVLMPLAVPRSLALREWWPLCSVDLGGQRSLAGPPGWGAAVLRWWCVLGRVLLVMCPGALEVWWCDATGPGSRSRCRALLADVLAGPLARLGLLGLVGAGGRWFPLSPWG